VDSGKKGSQAYSDLFGGGRPIVGMIHLMPLPGSPGFQGSMERVLERAGEEARILAESGLSAILVENYGDTPFFPARVPPETVAAMAVAVREVASSTDLPVGVNVLRNDAEAALAVAAAGGGRFVRVNVHVGSMFSDQGLLSGEAFQTLRKRAALGLPIPILADVMVKHATPPPGLTLESAARDCWFRGKADALILTGSETGRCINEDSLGRVRGALPPSAKIWVGSGATAENVSSLLESADGIIVGSALQRGGIAGGGIEGDRVRAFMEGVAG
jgi:membrane complex biogenesis BtpA family protein